MIRTFLLAAAFMYGIGAAADFQVPRLTGPVVDQAGMLSTSTADQLSRFLHNIRAQSGTQLQVATVRDLGGLSIEEASIKIVDNWKLGRKKEDRGILLLLAPSERRIRIEVGRGLEGDLPDVTANRIIREVIAPRLKEGSPDRAVTDGVMAILSYTDPTLLEQGAAQHVKKDRGLLDARFVIFLVIIGLWLIFSMRGRGGGFGGGGGYYGGWGSGSSSGGGFSSGGGGGWSGGGGGFSGGGSSGSW